MGMPTTHHDAKILVVDDEPHNVRLLEKMLKAEGYRYVTGTSDSSEVIKLYEQLHPDLVLLDIRMPHPDGFEIMEQLNLIEWGSYTPVMVLTAQTDRETRVRALETGAKDFLSKPFDQFEVLMRITNMLEVRLLHNESHNVNQLLEEKVQERTREIHDTQMEIIHRLGRAAEYKDNETGLHTIRMSHYARMVGEVAGLDARQSSLLLSASPMHDIGKIGIPDSILLKPGKLDTDEWETMKTHVMIGADILKGHDSALMTMALEIAMTHHEKWDGSGYPNGLSGEDIPLVGRIVALCDVFDALTTERPYKSAWSVEDAITEIKAQSGQHFDPELVELFMANLDQILEIRASHAEPEINSHAQPRAADG